MRNNPCNLISEEMLGAYLEGNLDPDSARAVELIMDANPEIEALAADVVSAEFYDPYAQPDFEAVDALDLHSLLPEIEVEAYDDVEVVADADIELVAAVDSDIADDFYSDGLTPDINDQDFMQDDSGTIGFDC